MEKAEAFDFRYPETWDETYNTYRNKAEALKNCIKVMKETANITPGIAYPDIEKADK